MIEQNIEPEALPPLGAILLQLRGAIDNLTEAIPTKNNDLIVKRRVELSRLVQSINDLNLTSIKGSLTKYRLILNLNEALTISTSILHDASFYLSEQLSLA